jgi:hypothetical protein
MTINWKDQPVVPNLDKINVKRIYAVTVIDQSAERKADVAVTVKARQAFSLRATGMRPAIEAPATGCSTASTTPARASAEGRAA